MMSKCRRQVPGILLQERQFFVHFRSGEQVMPAWAGQRRGTDFARLLRLSG